MHCEARRRKKDIGMVDITDRGRADEFHFQWNGATEGEMKRFTESFEEGVKNKKKRKNKVKRRQKKFVKKRKTRKKKRNRKENLARKRKEKEKLVK